MEPFARGLLLVAVLVTVAAVGAWIATGGDPYTKLEVIERVPVAADPSDPFAGTGLYDDEEPRYQAVKRKDFRFGLLPTPQGLLDLHMLSVTSTAVPVWVVCLGLLWWRRRTGRRREKTAPRETKGASP